ncbi:MAG: DUF2178 domain-containing protein [bacterium]|nr:DUF2178 domain-containing protein [bacterium]
MEFRKKLKLRLYAAVGYTAIGAVLIIISFFGAAENEMLSAFGAVFIVMGIARIVQHIRITKDEASLRDREIVETDERNVMLMTKARSLTFSIYIMLAGITMVVLYLLNKAFAAQIVAYAICTITLIYFVCYHIISRKY